jgi:O-antigen/teichoic acid export membrane protein
MSGAKTVFKNTTALAVGNILTRAGSLVFLGYMTRVLGESSFGRFSTAMALVGFVEVIPGYVSRPFIVRHVARERAKSGDFISGVISTNLILSVLLFLGFLLVVPHLGYAGETRLACYILAASLLFSSMMNSYHAVFAGNERMELSAVVDVFNAATTILIGIVVLLCGGGVIALVSVYFFSRILAFLLARRFAGPLLDGRAFKMPDSTLARSLITGAWPFFITQLFIIFYARADIVLLSFLNSTIDKEVAVGHYNAAYKLMEAMGLVTGSFVFAVYPVLARNFLKGAQGVLPTFRDSLRVLSAFVMPVAVGTTLLASDIMSLLFGADYAVAGFALQILIWGQVLDSINPLAASTMRALEREKDLAKITGAGAIFNVALNLVLIPIYSYPGAAVATLLSFVLVFAWGYKILREALGPLDMGRIIARPLLAAVLMGAAVWWARRFGFAAALGIGIVAYIPASFVFKVWTWDEFKSLTRFFLSRASSKRQNTPV